MKRSFSYVLNENKIRSNSTKIKDLQASNAKTVRLSLSNYNSNHIKEKIHRIQQQINSYKISNIKRSNELINNTKKYFSKKSLIFSLREDLEYHKKINYNYTAYERYTTDLCKCFKRNFEEIYIYKVNLTKELQDFIILLQEYEETKQELIKEKKLIRQSNDDIIKYKLEEQMKLNMQLTKLNEDLEKQNYTLNDLNNILKSNLSLNENNLKSLQNEELKYNEKLEKLEKAYKRLMNKYNYYEDIINNERKKKYVDETSINKEEKEESKIKLKEETLKNNYLKKVISDIKTKMDQIHSNNSNMTNTNSNSNFINYKSLGGKSLKKSDDKIKSNKSNELTISKLTESKFNYSSNMS